jgi:hypothetical protein
VTADVKKTTDGRCAGVMVGPTLQTL